MEYFCNQATHCVSSQDDLKAKWEWIQLTLQEEESVQEAIRELWLNIVKGLFHKSLNLLEQRATKIDEIIEFKLFETGPLNLIPEVECFSEIIENILIILKGDINKYFLESIRKNNVLLVEQLLKDPRVDPSENENEAIRNSSEFGHSEIVKLLLADSRVDPSDCENEAILYASYYGNTEVVRLLLADPRVDPSAQSNEAIRWGSLKGNTEVVRLLLADARVDPSDINNQAIRLASQNGHTGIVKLLLADARVDPSALNNNAICNASENGHTEIVELIKASPRYRP